MKNLIQLKYGNLKKVILRSFFKKSLANKASNRAKSAMSDQMKAAMKSAEIQRRCRNCSRDLPPDELDNILTEYMDELKAGGHISKWKRMILETGINGYITVWGKERNGTGRNYAPKPHGFRKRLSSTKMTMPSKTI